MHDTYCRCLRRHKCEECANGCVCQFDSQLNDVVDLNLRSVLSLGVSADKGQSILSRERGVVL